MCNKMYKMKSMACAVNFKLKRFLTLKVIHLWKNTAKPIFIYNKVFVYIVCYMLSIQISVYFGRK